MERQIIANTDRYGIVSWGNGIAYSMFNKKTNRSFFVQGDDAAAFRGKFLDLLNMSEIPGSVYHGMPMNQLLAQLFDQYEHIAEDDVGLTEMEDRISAH